MGLSENRSGFSLLDRDPSRYSKLKALVVDDSRFQRRILCSSLAKWGFQVSEADSGLSALELCRRDPPDIVLSDWMMPGMDGLEFCQKFREMDRESYGYFILLTSKSDKEEVAKGLHHGADDFLTKPVNPVELRARISAGERILGMEQQQQIQNRIIKDTLEELTRVYDSLDRDLAQARHIQQSLLPPPETHIESSTVSAVLRPAGHVGGDLVGVFDAGAGQIGFYNIDVSGHGVTSALMTARISGYLSGKFLDQNIALEKISRDLYTCLAPSIVAEMLNDRLLSDVGVAEYFTMAFATADLRSGRVRFAQSGHPNPLLIPANGSPRFLGQGGFPIGLLPDVSYETEEITLGDGDRLIFYSDGFTEALGKGGAMLDEDGLLRMVEDARDQEGLVFLEQLLERLSIFQPDPDQPEDDVSAIMLEYRSP